MKSEEKGKEPKLTRQHAEDPLLEKSISGVDAGNS